MDNTRTWTPCQIYSFKHELEAVTSLKKTLKPVKTVKLSDTLLLQDKIKELETR